MTLPWWREAVHRGAALRVASWMDCRAVAVAGRATQEIPFLLGFVSPCDMPCRCRGGGGGPPEMSFSVVSVLSVLKSCRAVARRRPPETRPLRSGFILSRAKGGE